jgi:hypothetical protein
MKRYSRCQVTQECTGCLIGAGPGSGGGGWSGRCLRMRLVLRGSVRHAGRVGPGSSGGGGGASGGGGGGSGPPAPGIGGFLSKKMRTVQADVKTSYQSGSNSPPGPYLAFIIIRYPSSLEETDVRTHERCIQAKTHCWMLRRSSRSLPTSPRSIRTSVASALLNSSRY